MVRTVGSRGPKTQQAIRAAGLKLIHRHGYEAISLRQLAQEVGIQPGSMYNYMASKQELLFTLIHDHMSALLAELDAVLAAAPQDDPVESLRRFIRFHVSYHIRRREDVFIGYSELRSLDPENRERVIALRRAYEGRLIALLRRGMDQGVLKQADAPVAAYAILSMLTGVCTWFRADGRLGEDAVIDLHLSLIMDGILA